MLASPVNPMLYGCKNWRLAKANTRRIEPDAPEPDAPEPDAPEPDAPEPDAPELDPPEPAAPEPDALDAHSKH